VLLDDGMLCLTVALGLPHPLAVADVTESYRWIGEALAAGLRSEGVSEVRAASVIDARAQTAVAKFVAPDSALRAACYGGLSPYEVIVGAAKVVGLAQARRKEVALFQIGILLRDQSDLAEVLVSADRERLRSELRTRTVGLNQLLPEPPDPEELAHRLHETIATALKS
jgi:lipoate-protein ligase A